MAEVKKTNDPKQDLREKQGSIFKTAAVSAPIAVGGGIGISRLLKSSTHFTQPIERIPNTARSDQIRRFANRYVSPEHAGVFKEWQLDKLAGFSDNTALSVEHVRSAMTRAAASVDPSGILSSMFDKRLAFAQTGKQAYEDIMQIMKSNTSVQTTKAVGAFLDDAGLLEQRVAAGLPIETQAMTPALKRFTPYLKYGELDPVMRAEISKMESLTGATIRIKETSRADIPGAQLDLEFFRGADQKRPWFNLRIPRVLKDQPGVITRGATQQSQYIAGTYGLVEQGVLKESFNHEQWMARRASEDLIPKIMEAKGQSTRAVRQAVHTFEQQMIEAPEWIPSMAPGTHQGLDEYVKLRSQVMRLYTPDETRGVRQINEFEFARIIEQGGVQTGTGKMPLFPGHSPAQIAKGVAATTDPREIFLVPEAASIKRRPFQRFRPGYTPTPGAQAAMASNAINQRFAWAADPYGVQTPMTRAAYLSGDMGPQLAGTGVTSEGQMLVSSRLKAERAVRQWQQFDVSSKQMVELSDMLGQEGSGHWDINKTMPKGTFLGYGPDGKPVVLPEDMHISSATAFTDDKAKGDFVRVMGMRDIEKMRYSKVFGGAKGMAVEVSPDYIESVLTGKAGMAQAGDEIFRGIDAVVTMDELKKNRALHYNQMFTSLWNFTNTNMQSGKQVSSLSSNFANNPRAVIAQMRAQALQSGKFNHDAMLQSMMGLARGARLSPQQMGLAFGAVPEVFGGLGALGKLSAAEAAEVSRGVATGMTQLYFEGLGGPGSGRTATIEPRMFELLGSPHFGKVGPALQTEVAQRMISAYPERLNEQAALNRAANSLVGGRKAKGAISVSEMLGKMREGLLPQGESAVRLPGGLGDMYVPGSGAVSQLSGYKTATGTVIQPDLAAAYKGVLDVAKQYEDRDVTIDVLNKEVDNLRGELNRARIATVTGDKGLLRNRLPGSAFLTAVQPTAADELAQGVVGITQPYAKKMFSELEATGLYNADELAGMQERFLAGEEIAGAIGRHPYIGPYSTQAAKFRLVPGNEAIAMINEKQMRAIAIKGQLDDQAMQSFEIGAQNAFKGNQHALRRMEQVGAEMMGSPIRMSPFVGLAGDVDGDVISAMFAGPQLEKSLSSHLADRSALDAYEEYAIRSQVLKAKGKGDAVTLQKAMAGDVFSLGITEGGRLGKLSSSLQQYRGAIVGGGGGLSPQEQTNALGLLEWMEQTPISGKHIAPGQEEKMIYLLDDIQQALDKKSANGIAEAARTVLAKAKMSGQAALRDGFTVAMEDVVTGDVATRRIPGIDISKAAENLVTARQAADTAAVGGLSADRMRRLMMGRADMSADEMTRIMQPSNLELSPFGAFFEAGPPPGKLASFAAEALSFSNKMGAAGRKMLAHAKPLAVGTGIGVAMAALLSEPPRVLGPAQSATPNLRSGSGGAGLSTNIHPSTQVSGMPTAQTMMDHANTARIAAPSSLQPEGYTININGAMKGLTSQQELTAQLQAAMGGRARVNSTVRDMRSSLTPQKLSSMLQD